MPVGRIALLLFIANWLIISLVRLVPEGNSLSSMLGPATELLSFSCRDGYWLDAHRVLSLALGVPLSAVGFVCFLTFGVYTREELLRKRNGASVMAACWLMAAAGILLGFSFFPCNGFYNGFAEAGGLSANRAGYALRSLLTGSWPMFTAYYSLFFCGISYCAALGLKLLITAPEHHVSQRR